MATLTSKTPANTYRDLLKIASTSDNLGITNSLLVVEDGDATGSSLSLSTGAAKITGVFEVTGLSTLANVAIASGTITGITDLAVADGGTGASTAATALNNLLPSQTSAASKYLQSDGTNASWDAVTLSTADITGTLAVANGGTGITSFGTDVATFLGTPSSANLASALTDETGTVFAVFATLPTFGTTGVKFSGSTSGTTTVLSGATAGTSELTLPVATDTLVGKATTDTLTNKTLTSPKFNENVALTSTSTQLNYVNGVTSAIQTQIDTKAPIASPTFTGTVTIPSGASISGFALLASPSLTGIPLAPTAVTGTNTTQIATTGFVQQEISIITTGAPGLLNTLDELAAALGDDANYAATITTALSAKAPLASPTFTGTVAGITKTMVGLANVDNTTDANKPVSTATQTALDLKVDESLFDAKGDLLVASADNTPAKLSIGTNGYLLTANSSATNGVEWAAAPVSLPSQTGNSGKYLTTDGSSATWGTLVVPITTGTATLTANTATTVDTTALSAFTSIEYMVSLKQASKTRTSKVIVQTDGTSVDMTEFAITETGGTMAGVVISATTASTNAVLQVIVTDSTSNNVTIKFSKIAL